MEYEADRWVQRLRDGVVPPLWPLVVWVVVLLVVGGGVLALEALHPERLEDVRRPFSLVGIPLVLVVVAVAIPIGIWRDSGRDRHALANAHRHGTPRFHLPVRPIGISAPQDLPDRRTALFTVDRSGLSGWSPGSAEPVLTIPWDSIERIDLATKDLRGQRVDYALWLTTTDGGSIVLQPRSALGRPFAASQTKPDILRRVLRSLRPATGTTRR